MDGLTRLADGTYRGRGLAVGPSTDGKSVVIVYWITGRSERSRNRRLVELDDGTVETEFIDARRGDDPALVVYPLLMSRGTMCVVSNGEQTQPILDVLYAGGTLESALESWTAEPDEIATPRINGVADISDPDLCRLGVVRERTEEGQSVTDRSVFSYERLPLGSGRCLTTYDGGSEDPAPFAGDPLCVLFENSPEATCERFCEVLDGPLLVSVIVRFAGLDGIRTAIVNLQD